VVIITITIITFVVSIFSLSSRARSLSFYSHSQSSLLFDFFNRPLSSLIMILML
jgi:hypothetical protein